MKTKLYGDLAAWWPLMSAPSDYEEEAAVYTQTLRDACAPRTVLELGSGGGNNASHMKAHFELTLADRSPDMLAVSRRLNPECEHVEGDMRDVRLGREFDAVFIHDAIDYLTTADDLAAAVETAFVHCRSGGVALLVPDFFRETFAASTSTGGHDGDGRGMRYLEWDIDPDPDDDTYEVWFAFLLRDGSDVEIVRDHHLHGLFPRARWLEICAAAGFRPELSTHELSGDEVLNLVLCRKP